MRGYSYDESSSSKKISDFLGLKNNTIKFHKNDLLEIINELPEAFDEPFADSSQIPTMLIFQKLSRFSKVCITGMEVMKFFTVITGIINGFNIWNNLFKKKFLIIFN